jgi:beta-xylosidase
VLPGDHPDPSVIRVGNEYWATATTSAWAPIFPLLKSTDLKTWWRVGAVFATRPEWAETNFWAPEIAEHKGRYFVYYTAKKRGGPLCVAVADAVKPEGPYTDHGPMVCQEVGSIDAVPVSDESGARWLIWKEDGNSKKQPTPLWAQRLSEDGLKLTGEKRELFRNDAPWEGQLVEGPFVLRRGPWWYMFYSGAGCCGRGCNYALGVARAKALLGPWEKYAGNPILKANDQWICPGHGSIVEDPQGHTWLLYHAYHPKDSIFVGRQGLLDEITWGGDGWPQIEGPSAGTSPKPWTFADEFDGRTLSPEWSWPANQQASVKLGSGALTIASQQGEAVVALSPRAADYTAETCVSVPAAGGGPSPGLAAWGSAANAIGVTVSNESISLWQRRDRKTEELATAPIASAKTLCLRMKATAGSQFAFSWSSDGKRWNDIRSSVSGTHLPPWDLATRVALHVSGRGESARFDNFRVH